MSILTKYTTSQGLQLVINDATCVKKEKIQFRFPKSKKKRIRKKWAKRDTNFKTIEKHVCYKIPNDVLVISSKIYNELEKISNVI